MVIKKQKPVFWGNKDVDRTADTVHDPELQWWLGRRAREKEGLDAKSAVLDTKRKVGGIEPLDLDSIPKDRGYHEDKNPTLLDLPAVGGKPPSDKVKTAGKRPMSLEDVPKDKRYSEDKNPTLPDIPPTGWGDRILYSLRKLFSRR